MSTHKNPVTLVSLPRELQDMVAVRLSDRTFPSISDRPSFGFLSADSAALAMTGTQMRDVVFDLHKDKSVLLATGLDSYELSSDADRQGVWEDIKKGLVKFVVIPVGELAKASPDPFQFEKTLRFLESFTRHAPEHSVATVMFDGAAADASALRDRGAHIAELYVATKSMFASRHSNEPSSILVRAPGVDHATVDCLILGLGSEARGPTTSTTYRMWGSKNFKALIGPAIRKSSVSVDPPRFNYNLSSASKDSVLTELDTFCKQRLWYMQQAAAEMADPVAFKAVVNLYADPTEYGNTSAEQSDADIITANEQVIQLGPQLSEILTQAGLSGESGHSMVLNLGVCDAIPYSVRTGKLATDAAVAVAGT